MASAAGAGQTPPVEAPPTPVNASWRDAKEACSEVFGPANAVQRYLGHGIDCAIRIFELEPIAPSVGKIVPGSGEGFGIASNVKIPADRWVNTWSSQVRGSTTNFWIAHSQLEFQRLIFDGANYNPNISLSATYWNLPQMPLYGLGSDTLKSDVVDFSQHEVFGGVNANYPFKIQSTTNDRTGATTYRGALVASAVFEVRAPHVSGVSAPGVMSPAGSDLFVRSGAALQYRHQILDPTTILQVSFDDYHDADSGRYSFERIEATGDQVLFSQPAAGRLFVHGRVSTSNASGGSTVPFYYQETLGGSDIDGVDTLRGYVDYRFRAPHLWLSQITYERAITVSIPRKNGGRFQFDVTPSVFDDIGDVAVNRSDLFAHAKNTYGIGLALRVGNRTLARTYFGFGSEDRPRFFLDFTSLAFQ
jgi:hypothetical protein